MERVICTNSDQSGMMRYFKGDIATIIQYPFNLQDDEYMQIELENGKQITVLTENWINTQFLMSNIQFFDKLSTNTIKIVRQNLINDRTKSNVSEINNYLADIDAILVLRGYSLPI